MVEPAVRHPLYPTIDDMLAPDSISQIEGGPVASVSRRPFVSSDSLSGSNFLLIETDGGAGPRFVLKRISRAWDWIMRASNDHQARSVVAWTDGLLDRLPAEITHGVVACARDGDGWAILMRELRDAMIPPGDDWITPADNERFLDAMAAMHTTFWGHPELADPARGFLDLTTRYRVLTPEAGRRESAGPDAIPPMIVAGWELLWTLVDRDVADVLRRLQDDPTPLSRALERFPRTVIHGDWKLGNLGIVREEPSRVVLLDWAAVGAAPPAVDLAWYLAVNSARIPVSKEQTIDYFRSRLERRLGPAFQEAWWAPQLDLALLGGFLLLAWPKALGAVKGETEAVRAREQAEITWWSERVRAGASRL